MYRQVAVSALSCRPRRWDKPGNADMVEDFIRRAAADKPDIVLTPEGVLEGYVVMEAIKDPSKRDAMLEIATGRKSDRSRDGECGQERGF